jgi:hypothetical protein
VSHFAKRKPCLNLKHLDVELKRRTAYRNAIGA